jgi:two-component system LytT family response regulator
MNMRVLIIDDEPWSRKRIATLLKSESDIEIVSECAGGEEAIRAITSSAPDMVFLDVQMPEVDGFEVLEAIGPEHMPLVIFATAYDRYAIQAFDAQAIDYLLKPFDEERFKKALTRARNEWKGKVSSEKVLSKLLDSIRPKQHYLHRLVANSAGRVLFLKLADIDWIEASGNYVTLHSGKECHMVRTTMNALEPRLDPAQFVRIHRCSIVNSDRVREMQPLFRGEHVLILKDGTHLNVGRAFRARLMQQMGSNVS